MVDLVSDRGSNPRASTECLTNTQTRKRRLNEAPFCHPRPRTRGPARASFLRLGRADSPAVSAEEGSLLMAHQHFRTRRLFFAAAAIGSATALACDADKIAGPASVASVSVTIASPVLIAYPRPGAAGSTTQATAIPRDADGNALTGRSITWSTDNSEVATVSVEGVVTAVSPGSATITATSEGKTGSATVTVNAPVPQVKQRSLALGTYHACAIGVDGVTYCWGAGYNGQLGNGAPNSSAPRPIIGDHKFSAVSAAMNTTYAVNADGELYCWGGEPCDPTARNPIDEYNGPAVLQAKRMATSRTIEVIGTGSPVGGNYVPMCAIGVEYVAYCWGKNESGQLGLGSSSSETVLAPDRPVVGNHPFKDVAEGVNHVCALNYGGRPYCWGSGSFGALGDGSGANSAEPRAVWSNQAFEMIGAGSFFACGLTNVTVYCWGANDVGQLGTTTGTCLGASIPCSATPVAVSSSHLFDFLAVGGDRACGVASTGDIYCWGRGFGPTPTRFRSVLAAESGGVRFATVDLGASHICAISTTGDAWCGGSNHLGQLGNGSYTPSEEPTMVIGGVKFRTP